MMVVVGRWLTRLMDAMEGAAGSAGRGAESVGLSERRRAAAFLLFVGLVAVGIGAAMRLGGLGDLRDDSAVLERLEARGTSADVRVVDVVSRFRGGDSSVVTVALPLAWHPAAKVDLLGTRYK